MASVYNPAKRIAAENLIEALRTVLRDNVKPFSIKYGDQTIKSDAISVVPPAKVKEVQALLDVYDVTPTFIPERR